MLIFVDGSSAAPNGGVGVVTVANVGDLTIVSGVGYPLPAGMKCTNQRAEVHAIRVATKLVKTPSLLWSDSTYALGNIQPDISGWMLKSNHDIVVPARKEVAASGIKAMHHVTSHVQKKRPGFPPMLFHEVADELAASAAKTSKEHRRLVFDRRACPACITCTLFPCKGSTNYDAPCADRKEWPHSIVEAFNPDSIVSFL
jgi:ribonuclease HI